MLEISVVAVNDNKTKHLVDNFYGTDRVLLMVYYASNTLCRQEFLSVAMVIKVRD